MAEMIGVHSDGNSHSAGPTEDTDVGQFRPRRLAVIGGAGGMGRWLVEHVFRYERELDVYLVDMHPSTVEVAEELSEPNSFGPVFGVEVAIGRADPYAAEIVASADIVMIAVPIAEVAATLALWSPYIKPGSLLFDVCSVKQEPMQSMLSHADLGIAVVGTHPMFGVRSESVVGQKVIVCEATEPTDPRIVWLRKTFASHGAEVVELTASEHDDAVSLIQSLPHFIVLAIAATLDALANDVDAIVKCQTPPFRMLTSLIGRILDLQSEGQAPLYASIQRSDAAPEIRTAFLASAHELDEAFANGDPEAVVTRIEKLSHSFSPRLLAGWSNESDHAVAAQRAVDLNLQQLLRDGKPCGIESSGRIYVGRVVRYDATQIDLQGAVVRDSEGSPIGIIYDEESATAARKRGVSSNVTVQTISRSSARLISGAEFAEWRSLTLPTQELELSMHLPKDADPSRIGSILVRLIDGLLRCDFVEWYQRPNGGRKAIYKAEIVSDRTPVSLTREIGAEINAIGGTIPGVAVNRPAVA